MFTSLVYQRGIHKIGISYSKKPFKWFRNLDTTRSSLIDFFFLYKSRREESRARVIDRDSSLGSISFAKVFRDFAYYTGSTFKICIAKKILRDLTANSYSRGGREIDHLYSR